MDTMDIFIGYAVSDDLTVLDDLASLYNLKVISRDLEYATLEGSPEDLVQFGEFWSLHLLGYKEA